MRGGIVGSICFLALLLSAGRTEDSVELSKKDLSPVVSVSEANSVTAVSEDEESRSGAKVEGSVGNGGESVLAEDEEDVSGGVSSTPRTAQPETSSSAQTDSLNQGFSASPQKNHLHRPVPSPYRVSPNSDESPEESRSFAHAKAVAQDMGTQGVLPHNNRANNPFRSYYPLHQGTGSQAQAVANAQTQTNNVYHPINSLPSTYNLKVSPYNVRADLYSQSALQSLGSNAANAQAEAQSSGDVGSAPFNHGMNSHLPYYRFDTPSFPNNQGTSASAQAQAIANEGSSPYNPGLPYYPNSPYRSLSPENLGLSSASAQASSGDGSPRQSPYNPYSSYAPRPSNSPGFSSAQAEATAIGRSSPVDPLDSQSSENLPPRVPTAATGVKRQESEERHQPGYLSSEEYHSSEVQMASEGSSEASSRSGYITSLSVFDGAKSRILMPDEYIYPYKMSGGRVFTCTQKHQMFNLWTPQLECLVCICVSELNMLSPLCASCSGCRTNPEPPKPIAVPLEPYAVTVKPYPITVPPVLDVTCKPLPSGRPFTNPLNPCQLCVCMESINAMGKPDVQIECNENPQCVVPPEATAIIPDGPAPVPLPMCEKFPPNVLFPHPTDTCKICKCSVQMSEFGFPQQEITCTPNPDCVPPPAPVPRVTPAPVPDIVTVVPVPWPPTLREPVPMPPSPLPGPSPHESCRPFPPNQVFQHPWDECQVCMCTESFAVGMITVEVNCYTKPTCCVEPPEQMMLPPSTPYPTIPGPLPYAGGSGSAMANAEAIASFNNKQQMSGGGDLMFGGAELRPSLPLNYGSEGSQAHASAGSSAVAQAESVVGGDGGYYYPEQYQQGRQRHDMTGNGQSSASAAALGESLAQGNMPAELMYQGGYNKYYAGDMNAGYMNMDYLNGGNAMQSGSSAKAEAQAQALHNGNGNLGGYGGVVDMSGMTNPNPYAMQGVPASSFYPSMYTKPRYEITPLYQPGSFRDSFSSKATAQSVASASNTQSQATATAVSGRNRFSGKSGNPEESKESRESKEST